MGAENSILDSYKLSEPLIKQTSARQLWTIRPGLNDKAQRVTIFSHDRSIASTTHQEGLENATKVNDLNQK